MKKIIFLAVLIGILVLSLNFFRSSYELWRKQDVLTKAQNELLREKEENKKLKDSLELAQKQDYIEKQARNKLFLVKEGEQEVLIPSDLIMGTNSATTIEDNRPNWQKWIDLFF